MLPLAYSAIATIIDCGCDCVQPSALEECLSYTETLDIVMPIGSDGKSGEQVNINTLHLDKSHTHVSMHYTRIAVKHYTYPLSPIFLLLYYYCTNDS